jgi:hypothetical protein
MHEGLIATEITAGELADCWFLGAAAAVATKPDLLLSLFVRWDTEYGVFTVSDLRQSVRRESLVTRRQAMH